MLAFDLETTGVDATSQVTCAATLLRHEGHSELKLWHSDYADVMTADTANDLTRYMAEQTDRGVTLVTFNGTKFDFPMLAKTGSMPGQLRTLAMAHCDIMLQFAVQNGYFASMDSFAQGSGIAPKTWNGLEASQAWETGDRTARKRVVDYCGEDVRCLLDLAQLIAKDKQAARQTKRGSRQIVPFRKLMNVDECLDMLSTSPPDQSWMDTPPDLHKLFNWATGQDG